MQSILQKKKTFEPPYIDVITVSPKDIVTSSPGDNLGEWDEQFDL